MFLKIKDIIKKNFDEKTSDVLLGVCLGDTDEIENNLKEDFTKSNISHILAVSGMHVAYVIIVSEVVFGNLLGKRIGKKLTMFILLSYMFITGLSPSVVRACVMAIFVLWGEILYRKSDVFQSMSIAILVLLIYNPFLIKSVSVILTFFGTIGILCFTNKLKKFLKIKNIIIKKIIEMIIVTISATIMIMPIIIIYFNKLYITSLLISVIIGFIIGGVIIGGMIFVILYKVWYWFDLKNMVVDIVSYIVKFVIMLLCLK